jgi:hypothetical protein
MNNEQNANQPLFPIVINVISRLKALDERVAKLDRESNVKDELIESLTNENESLKEELWDKATQIKWLNEKVMELAVNPTRLEKRIEKTKTIYILTEGDYEDKNTIGVFDSIELASFAKKQFDETQEHDWDHADIEEYTLNYCWELQRVLAEQDKPVNVIDPSTLFVRGHSVE